MWICAGPYTLGEYLCYDLNKVFNNSEPLKHENSIINANENIDKDEFLSNGGYSNYMRFKNIRMQLKEEYRIVENQQSLVKEMISVNPDSYLSYSDAGDFQLKHKYYAEALEYFNIALQKQIPTKQEKDHIEKGIDHCKRKLNRKRVA
jgi:hypothetical protein